MEGVKACMNGRSLLLTVGVMAVIFLLVPLSTAQAASSVIYGYVSVGGVSINGITVTLVDMSGKSADQHNVTSNDNSGNHGYYSFIVNGSEYTLSAVYNGYSDSHTIIVSSGTNIAIDLSIPTSTPTPIPTVTITATPTPRPLNDIGGMVTSTNQTSYIPMEASNPSPTPIPMWTPTPAPSIHPSVTLAPTTVPSSGIFSNISLWLIGTVVAIIAIIAVAAVVLVYIRRY